MDAVALRLLGPMQLRVDGTTVELGGPRRRAVLAYLVLHRGAAVAAERIVAEVWGPDANDGARRSLQTYVSALRGLLAHPEHGPTITYDTGGYRLEIGGAWLDIDRFERAATRAFRDADPVAAAHACELWRGEPLQDVAVGDWAAPTIAALHELHRRTVLIHLDALLAARRYQEVLGTVADALVAAPFDEELWERRMLALYHSGRQTEALEAFAALEGTLREELGLEPGRTLVARQRQILLHDPGLAEPSAPPHVVPASLSSFVGRSSELAHLDALAGEHRLLTISGPGGVGKTRAALELAHAWRGRIRDGVYFVDLGSLTEGERIAGEIAGRLGADRPRGDVLAHLGTHLADDASLLVLDNAEHLRDDVAAVVRTLLESAPALRIVVTSRVALGLTGEVVWQLPPLDLPREDDPADRLAQRDAVVLFVRRAQEVRPAIGFGPTDLASVGRICRRLDGLPLAIEIAASRLRSMAVSDLEARLAHDLGTLRSVDPTVTERHRTLTAVLGWSTERLDAATVRVFARLAVIPGSFDLAAAAALCRATTSETSDHLDLLVQHSLLGTDPTGSASRYRMLEVVRDHASELLARTDDREDAERALIGWGLDLTHRAAIGRVVTEESSWVASLAADHAALRAALAAGLAHDPPSGLLLATRLVRFWWANAGDPDARGSRALPTLHEGIDWLERLLEVADADVRTRAAGQVALGFLRELVGDHAAARAVLVEARDAMDAVGEIRLAGWAALYLGNVAWGEGSSEAGEHYREARERFTTAGDREGQGATAVLEFSYLLRAQGPAAASDALHRVLRHTEGESARTLSAYRAGVLALHALARGEPEEAREPLLRAMERTRSATDPATTAIVLGIGAWYSALAGHVPTAALLIAVAEAVEARSGLRFKQGAFAREFTREVLGDTLTSEVEAVARHEAGGLPVEHALGRLRDLLEADAPA